MYLRVEYKTDLLDLNINCHSFFIMISKDNYFLFFLNNNYKKNVL